MKNKKPKFNTRKNAIQELIKTYAIEDQTELLEFLKTKYNIETNQAAISRDLRKLGIAKRLRGDRMVYELPTINVVNEILYYAVKSIRHNETLIVINTVPGTAAFVGDFLDAQHNLPILGTLAGENVVLVIPQSTKHIESLEQQLTQFIKLKE
ncbi:MAG TPA: hypothetical protein PLU71_03510 [Candidatus Dependentiae bacterium]|nr:hypothetical protein [Candidatus Dependentiae bacterium]HRQ62900.1 hypothetical protein [Candidatus Dependentiae bacterium]